MVKLLYWIELDCTSIPNKVVIECIKKCIYKETY